MQKRIRTLWEEYRGLVIPADAPPVQVRESRKAFYSGAATIFGALTGGVSPGLEVQDSDMQMMDDLAAELKEFRDEMVREAQRLSTQ
jgi:hypothetical protein